MDVASPTAWARLRARAASVRDYWRAAHLEAFGALIVRDDGAAASGGEPPAEGRPATTS